MGKIVATQQLHSIFIQTPKMISERQQLKYTFSYINFAKAANTPLDSVVVGWTVLELQAEGVISAARRLVDSRLA